jgi:hypothetical protein
MEFDVQNLPSADLPETELTPKRDEERHKMSKSETNRRYFPSLTLAAATAIASVIVFTPFATSAQDEVSPDAGSAEPTVVRTPAESEDPMVTEEVERLDASGLIRRQARIGEDILVLDREIRRAEAVQSLVSQMGYEAFLAAYPDLAASFAESPILLQAEIDTLGLKRELERLRKGEADAPVEPERTAPRNDGSDFFQIPVRSEDTRGPAEPEIETSTDIEVPAEVKDRDIPISLREIYGSSGRFFAVIAHGVDRIRVEAGDELPGDTIIEAVGENWVDVNRRGETVRIFIRG